MLFRTKTFVRLSREKKNRPKIITSLHHNTPVTETDFTPYIRMNIGPIMQIYPHNKTTTVRKECIFVRGPRRKENGRWHLNRTKNKIIVTQTNHSGCSFTKPDRETF